MSAKEATTVAPRSIPSYPEGWTLSRFGRELSINEGLVDPTEEPWALLRLIAPNHVERGTGRLLDSVTAAEQGAISGKALVAAGQIIYSKIRPSLNKVVIAPEDCLCSADMYAVTCQSTADARYAHYQMLAKPFHSYVTATSDRVKMPKVNREELNAAPWLVPPPDQQRAIADFLDREAAQIDTLIAKQQQLVEALRERRVGVSDSVLAAGVGRGDRLKYRLMERDERAGSRSTDLTLMSVSIDWGVRPRSEVADTPARSEDLGHYKVAHAGDIVVNRMRAFQGALGVAPMTGIVSPDYSVIAVADGVSASWLAGAMRTKRFVSEMTLRLKGIGGVDSGLVRTPRINVSDLLDIRVEIPDRDRQSAQWQQTSLHLESITSLTQKAQQLIDLAHEHRSALITAAVTGQFTVPDRAA